jgi:GNAT superfamily N-acetyltransferase
MFRIDVAKTDGERLECFEVMKELRTHLVKERFLETLHRMAAEGYELAGLWDEGEVRAVCGFRRMEMIATGPILYVDDLVTAANRRGRGYGAKLLAYVREIARTRGCMYLELDSGSRRLDAHRFYRSQGLEEVALHFSAPLSGQKWTEPDLGVSSSDTGDGS